MNKFGLTSTVSLLALFSAGHAFAAEAPAPDVTALDVDEIVVTATRTPTLLSQVGSSITVVNREQIESSQAVVISDLITQTPGVSFSRNGGTGGLTSVRIRGAEADQTIVVIDGVKLNDPSATGGGYNFATLLSGDIARVEVLRGAQSTLWGSQAIGGVVNIVTAEATKPFEASAQGEGGSRATGYGRIGAGGKTDRVNWRLAGSRFVTDGFSAIATGREKDGYQNSGASGRVTFDVVDNVSVDVRSVYSHGHTQIDSTTADTAEFSMVTEWLGYGGINFDLLDGRLKSRAAYAFTNTDRDNANPDQRNTKVTFDARGRNRRFEYQGSLLIQEGWNAVFGAEREDSSFRTASPTAAAPNPVPAVASVGITSLYTQLQAEVVSGFTLTGGLRYDDHETFGNRVLGQAAAAWALKDIGTVFRASFGQGFKAPTLFQLFSNFGNSALKPEEANSWDGGVEQHFFDGAVVLSATGFTRKNINQIEFVSCPSANPFCTTGRTGVYDNITRTRAKGVELAAAAQIESLSLQANYTLVDAKNASPGNVNNGKFLTRRPKNTANFSATYTWPFDVSTGVAVRYVGDSFDNATNAFRLEDYTLVDLHTAWQVNETVEVYGRVENLFDKVYATIRNYGSARRGFFAGVRAKF